MSITIASNVRSKDVMSRLRIWMTPVQENQIDQLGDFKMWTDESEDSMSTLDDRILEPIGGNPYEGGGHLRIKKDYACKLGCHQCQNKNRRSPSSVLGSSSFSSSSDGSDGFSEELDKDGIIGSIMNMSIGIWKPLKSCGFCYIQYKRHCQRLGIPYPRVSDPGFWLGHTTKNERGEVICPELQKIRCPLCFATGLKAHTYKFCPIKQHMSH